VRPDPAPTTPDPHPRRALLLNVALSVAVTAIVVMAGEGLARWLEPPARPRPLADTRGLDWQAEWQGDFYVVKSDAVGWPPAQDFNRDGLRDRPHPLEKPPGTYRVVCLGDSVTFGYGFTRAEAWPQSLQDLVDARGPGVEVFSVALPGWSTRQERYAYERIARRYRPDAVVLAVVLNDMEDLHNNLSQPPRLLVELFKRSALVRRVTNAEGREIRSVDELFARRFLREHGDDVVFRANEEAVAALSLALGQAKVAFTALVPRPTSLEELFLGMTEGEPEEQPTNEAVA
jgi:hypothetical protein